MDAYLWGFAFIHLQEHRVLRSGTDADDEEVYGERGVPVHPEEALCRSLRFSTHRLFVELKLAWSCWKRFGLSVPVKGNYNSAAYRDISNSTVYTYLHTYTKKVPGMHTCSSATHLFLA